MFFTLWRAFRSSRTKRFSRHDRGRKPYRPALESLEDRLAPATITWRGPNNGDWAVPANWDLSRIPVASDDVVIASANATVIHSSGTDTVNSLSDGQNLTISGGALTVSNGFTQAAFRTLAAISGGSFTGNGATTFDGASLFASGGGKINLPGAASYTNTTTDSYQHRTWHVDGSGSMLNLGNLTTITNGLNYDALLTIEAVKASDGTSGTIDLHSVTKIQDGTGGDTRFRRINVTADGTGALVNLSALTSFTGTTRFDQFSYSTLTASNGGTVQVPALTTLNLAQINYDGTGTLPTAQITTFTYSYANIKGGPPSFAGVTTIQGSVFGVDKVSVTLPAATTINEAQFFISGGGLLALPMATSYTNTTYDSYFHRTWQVSGAGSKLDLSHLTTITNGLNYDALLAIQAVKASDGTSGTIDLSRVMKIQDATGGDTRYRRINVTADGTGALVDLSALTSFTGTTRFGEFYYSTLTASNGGTVQVPALTTLNMAQINYDGTGTLPTAQFTSFTYSYANIKGGPPSFAGVTTIQGSVFGVDRVSVTLPAATAINEAQFFVSGGGMLALPAALSYMNMTYDSYFHRTWQVSGAGSKLDLSHLTTITNGTNYDALLTIQAVKASDGTSGTIDLSRVMKIQDATGGDTRFRRINVTADGTGALVDLSALTSFTGTTRFDQFSYSTLTASSGGTVQVPALATLNLAQINYDGTGTLPTAQITTFTYSYANIKGGPPSFVGVTTIQGSVFGVDRVSVTLPAATTINEAQFFVSGGGTLALPAAFSYTNTTYDSYFHRTWQVSGAGSKLDLSHLTTITNGLNYDALLTIQAVKASDGTSGTIDLSGVMKIQDGTGGDTRFRRINVTADGTGALVNLSALTSFTGTTRFNQFYYSTLTASNGGAIKNLSLDTLNMVALNLDGTGALSTGQIVNLTFSAVTMSGTAPDFSSLMDASGTVFTVDMVAVTMANVTKIDGVSMTVTGGGQLMMVAANSYTNTTYDKSFHRSWHADGPGSAIALPNLTFISNGTNYDAEFYLRATLGGKIDLPSVTRMVDGESGDDRYRAIFITADGNGSSINLPGLSLLSNTSRGDQFQYTTVKATNNASITLGSGTTSLLGDVNVVLTNNATIFAGTLDLGERSLLNGTGTLAGNLSISNGTAQVAGTNDFVTVGGTYTQTFGTLTGAGNLTVNGLLTWSGGTMSGSGKTAARGGLAISGDANKVLDGRTVDNFGAGTWTGIGNVIFNNGARFNNLIGATLDAQSDATLQLGTGAAPSFLNAGTFSKSNTQGLPTIVAIPFNNTGTVRVSAGTLNLSGAFTNFANNTLTGGTYIVAGTLQFTNANIVTNAATIVLDGSGPGQVLDQNSNNGLANFATNRGSFTMQNGARLTTVATITNAGIMAIGAGCTFTAGGGYTQTGGTTTLSGGTLTASGLVDIQVGVLSGSGSINADVRNNGRIDVGGAGVAGQLTINGNYLQTAAGVLNIDIGGYGAGTGYDRLMVSGSANLDGTLNVFLINGFTPMSGNAFQIVTCGVAVNGTFATVNADPLFMPPIYNPMDVTLAV
jgi:autotransporter-associated beta strand protein